MYCTQCRKTTRDTIEALNLLAQNENKHKCTMWIRNWRENCYRAEYAAAASCCINQYSTDDRTFLREMTQWPLYSVWHQINWCIFTWIKFLPHFIPIQFETTEPLAFWRRSPPNQKNNKNNEMSSDMGSVPDTTKSRNRNHTLTKAVWNTKRKQRIRTLPGEITGHLADAGPPQLSAVQSRCLDGRHLQSAHQFQRSSHWVETASTRSSALNLPDVAWPPAASDSTTQYSYLAC